MSARDDENLRISLQFLICLFMAKEEHTISLEKEDASPASKGHTIRVPITLTWEDISFSVKVATRRCPPWSQQKKKKVILQDINGIVKPGQMLAIMGSTGAGKSSLLDVLADRFVDLHPTCVTTKKRCAEKVLGK